MGLLVKEDWSNEINQFKNKFQLNFILNREKIQVFDIAWEVGSDNKLVTCGVKHIKVSLIKHFITFQILKHIPKTFDFSSGRCAETHCRISEACSEKRGSCRRCCACARGGVQWRSAVRWAGTCTNGGKTTWKERYHTLTTSVELFVLILTLYWEENWTVWLCFF